MKKYLRDCQMTDGKLYLSSGDMKNFFLKFHFTSFASIARLLFSFRNFIKSHFLFVFSNPFMLIY